MNARDSCDVLIVGGGPAGSSCARRLRANGMDVVVMDKAGFPRDKVCAGWITPAVVDALALDLEDYHNGRVLQPIHRFRTGVLGRAALETDYDTLVSYGIRRVEFDHYLLQRSGARLRLGEAVRSVERVTDGWRVNGTMHARVLVGAGGHFCPVARHLGGVPGGIPGVVTAQEVEFRMTPAQAAACHVRADRPELYFCADLRGYGWCLRKGDYLNVGLGRDDNHHLAQHVDDFMHALRQQQRIPPDMPTRFHGHAYLLYPYAPRPLVDDAVLLVGDAAGLASAQSGEGIRPAVESGWLAAETILAAAGDYGCARLASYAERIAQRYGRRNSGGSTSVPPAWKTALGRRLLDQRWFARHVVLDRWFLHRGQAGRLARITG